MQAIAARPLPAVCTGVRPARFSHAHKGSRGQRPPQTNVLVRPTPQDTELASDRRAHWRTPPSLASIVLAERGTVSMRCVLTVHVVSILDVASRRVASSEASVSKRIARSSLCATSNNVGFGLEVVTFRLALAAERHRG